MKTGLVGRQNHQVVCVAEIVFYALLLLEPMIEARQVEIGKILAEIIPDRNTGHAVDNLVQEREQPIIFQLPQKLGLEDIMPDGRIELPDVQFQAIHRSCLIPECSLHCFEGTMDAPSFYAGIGVGCKLSHENRLQDVHNGMVRDPVGEVWQSVYLSLLGLIYFKGGI